MFNYPNLNSAVARTNEWKNTQGELITLVTTDYDSDAGDWLVDVYHNHNLILADIPKNNVGSELEAQGVAW